ncbi:MAG: adenosylcobinamide-GDP ribazoletransferase [Alphaproteobacteria bacterium]
MTMNTDGVVTALNELRHGLMFLTRLPLPGAAVENPAPLAKSAWAFPLAGLVVAVPAAVIYALTTSLGLSPLPASVLCLACMVALSGALHEDGLADLADGFGGGADREQKLEIMRDSRIGAFGVVALALTLAARIAAIAAIADAALVTGAVIAAAALSRASMACVMYALPAARDDGLGKGAGKPAGRAVIAAVTLAFVIALAALDWKGADAALAAAFIGAGAVALLARRQIGGHTGDVLGAAQQMAEIAILLTLAALMAPAG